MSEKYNFPSLVRIKYSESRINLGMFVGRLAGQLGSENRLLMQLLPHKKKILPLILEHFIVASQ